MSSIVTAAEQRNLGGGLPETCLVLIPALNEEATIRQVVSDLQRHGFHRIRVIDNGSSDRTARRAQLAGADVTTEGRRGYGRACWTALRHLPSDVKWILFCDADGSSDLRDLIRMIKVADSADLVLGNRRNNSANRGTMTFPQVFGNALATRLIHWGWGYRYADLGPLRLIRVNALDRMAMADRGFGWTVEMQVRALELGLRVREISVRYRQRQGGRSKISGTLAGTVRAGAVIVSTIGKLYLTRWWRLVDQPASLNFAVVQGDHRPPPDHLSKLATARS